MTCCSLIAAGIVNPIEAKVRKGKGAVGAYGTERTRQSLQDFPVVDSDEEEEKVMLTKFVFAFCFHPDPLLYYIAEVVL